MLLHVNGVGNIVADCEVASINEKSKVVSFRVASSERVLEKGQYVDRPSFTNVKLILKKESTFDKYLVKGQSVEIHGKLVEERWDDKETKKKRSKHIVDCTGTGLGVGLIGGKKDKGEKDSVEPEAIPQKQESTSKKEIPEIDINDDEIPF